MLTTKNRWLALVLCLLLTALGSTTAWAEGDGWIESAGNGGPNTLTVKATGVDPDGQASDADKAYAADLETANVVVDVYQVGTAVTADDGSITFEMVDPYATEDNNRLLGNILSGESGSSGWELLAQSCVSIAEMHGGTVKAGETVPNLDDGLYLLIAHGADSTTKLTAKSATYTYSFSPSLVVLPNKDADSDEWQREVTVILKSECEKNPEKTPPDDNPPKENPPKENTPTTPTTTPTTPTTRQSTVKTGETARLQPFYVAMTVSGVLLAVLLLDSVRVRRKNREKAG